MLTPDAFLFFLSESDACYITGDFFIAVFIQWFDPHLQYSLPIGLLPDCCKHFLYVQYCNRPLQPALASLHSQYHSINTTSVIEG